MGDARDLPVNEPIALIGLAFRLPGGADNIDKLWTLLEGGQSAWTEVPVDRFNGEAFFHPDPDNPNGTNNHPGGHFISGDIRDFDHNFFRFSKAQAAALDPQQRLLMELTWEALESAGVTRQSIAGTATSVYTACFPTDYERQLDRDPLNVPVHYGIGTEKALLSNRLSHVLDARGPSITMDTACSGGLTALHQACQSLQSGESTTAIVAATNLILGPDQLTGLSSLHLVSNTGRCFPFDTRGNGYGRAEGVVVLILRPLADALRSRDPVRAVIRSTAAGQDGYTPQNITFPSYRAQASLMKSALPRAGLKPNDIDYVEAHGTGTVTGDIEEMRGIRQTFLDGANRPRELLVGSMKGATGHAECVSGLAAVLKAAAVLAHGLVPPVAGFSNPKPGLSLGGIHIPKDIVPLPRKDSVTPPRMALNCFGFGGSNVCAILERAPPVSDTKSVACPRLFTLSANSAASLDLMIKAYLEWVTKRGEDELPMTDLSYTLLHRRTALPYRYSAVAHDRASLLSEWTKGVARIAQPVPKKTKMVFIFSGQGAQWVGMCRELMLETATPSSVFRRSIRASQDTLHTLGAAWSLEEEILRGEAESRLDEAEIAQPVTTAVQIALVTLLRAQGVRPHAVLGHSSGEIAAAFAAGFLSQEAAMKIAYHRGFMAAAVRSRGLGPGAMLAVGLGEQQVTKYLLGLAKGKACVACVNSPQSVTISGDAEAVQEVAERLAADGGIFHRALNVDTAYHSHHMSLVAEEYRCRISECGLPVHSEGSDITFISSVTGQVRTSGFDADYWVSNLISPVLFAPAIQTLYKQLQGSGDLNLFVEIGPHSSLAGPVRHSLQQLDVPTAMIKYLAPLKRGTSASESTLAFCGQLFENGVSFSWDAVSALAPGAGTASVRHDLPPYPWDHSTKHWHESRISKAHRQRKEPYHDLLGVPALDGTDLEPRWRHFISIGTLPWLKDHVVDGLTVFPGSGYLCMAVESVAQLARLRHPTQSLETVALSDVSFERALVVPETQRVEMQLSLKPRASSSNLSFEFTVMALSDDETWYEHAKGVVEGIWADDSPRAISHEIHCVELPHIPPSSQSMLQDDLYSKLRAVGNAYGPTFAGLSSMTMPSDSSGAAISTLKVQDIRSVMPANYQRPHVIHPATLDTILHSALPIAGRRLGPGSIMPVRVEELLVSVCSSVKTPGSVLDIATSITGSRYRTAFSELSVVASGIRVLSASGIELKSFASRQTGQDQGVVANAREICYELGWHADIEHLRQEDLTEHPSLPEVVSAIGLKRHGLSVVGLGASVDLSEEVLHIIQRHDHNDVVQYYLVDTTPEKFKVATTRLKDYNLKCRTLSPEMHPQDLGFETGSYDVVLTSSAEWLNQAAFLVKPGGTVLLVSSTPDLCERPVYQALETTTVALDFQVAFRDSRDRFVTVARRRPSSTKLLEKIHLVTHSGPGACPTWVSAVDRGLRVRNAEVFLHTLSHESIDDLIDGMRDTGDSTVIVIMDDEPLPILSNPCAFASATKLLTMPSRILWISPDEPHAFHQIEGVARTAHSENEELRMTNVHIASEFLENESSHGRFVDLVASLVGNLADKMKEHMEREYRIRANGTVAIPRLHRSDRLNQAVNQTSDLPFKMRTQAFCDSARPLILSSDDAASFLDDLDAQSTPLADNEIEVETRTMVLSARTENVGHAQVGEYGGVVAKVGKNVTSMAPGDAVLVLAPKKGASRLRICHTHAIHSPFKPDDTTAAALLLDTVAALYALRVRAPIRSTNGTVLIHGARTTFGRAAIGVARSMGLRVTATAADEAESRLLKQDVDIDAADILIMRRSLHRSSPEEIFPNGIDAIIQFGSSTAICEAWKLIRPFGSVVVLGTELPLGEKGRLPPNVGIHRVDASSLMEARPDVAAELLAYANSSLDLVPLKGLDIPVRNITDVGEALRFINTGVHKKVVLQAGPQSTVQVLCPLDFNCWTVQDATYVVTGGLGDIGLQLLYQMVKLGAKHVATISRRDLNEERRQELEKKLKAIRPGARLYMLQGDVTSEISMRNAAMALTLAGAPPVRGIIQSAMIMMERTLGLMKHEEFTSATEAKVQGVQNLYRAFSSSRLEFVLSLSSLAGITGAGGLGGYNAGNTVQDFLAQQNLDKRDTRNKESPRFVTVNFGLIDDAVFTANDDRRQSHLRRAGFISIRREELTRFFDFVLSGIMESQPSELRQAIIGADAASLSGVVARNSTVHSAMFCHIRKGPPRAAMTGTNGDAYPSSTFEQVLAEGDTIAVVEFVSLGLACQLARLIDVDTASIDTRHSSILDLGIDSLVAVELRNWMTTEFKCPLQSSEILVDQTVWSLAEKIVARATGTSPPSHTGNEAKTGQTSEDVQKAPPLPSLTRNADQKSVSHKRLDLKSVLRAFQDTKARTDEYISKSKFSTYSTEWIPQSDAIALAIFCNALEEFGCLIRSSASGTHLERVSSVPSHEKLVNHMYTQLQKHHLIQIRDSRIFRTDTPCPSQDIEHALDQLSHSRPGQEAEIKLMRLMGGNFGRCLKGEVDAEQLMFGDPETRETLARQYTSSELNSVILHQLTDFLAVVARLWDEKTEPLRILEVGGGTGGTTSWLLPMLARLNVPVLYTFTDIGPMFVKQASSKFKEFSFMRYQVLDIEQQPSRELWNTQHIVLGTNVIHATRDVSRSLENLRALLRPDGFAIIAEMTSHMLWTDVVFGLFSGFWVFEDARHHATQDTNAWKRSFQAAGFGPVAWTQGQRPESVLQSLIVSMPPDFDKEDGNTHMAKD